MKSTTEHGILFSHASEAVGNLVAGGFESAAVAQAHGNSVCLAQPGIEYEPMTRANGGPWLSPAGHTSAEVFVHRWPA